MIDHLSASQINLYIQCSLKYRFQYIDQVPRPFKPSGLAFGSVMHSALEWFHKERLKKKEVALDRFLKIFETDWYAQKADEQIRFKDGEDETKLLIMGKEMLGLYFRSSPKEAKSAEVSFNVPLLNGNGEDLGVPLEGFIDLIEADDVIVEFKTSGQAIDRRSLADNLQLTAYSYAYKLLFGKEPSALRVINFVKTRSPKMVPLNTSRSSKDHQRLFFIAREVLRGIRSGLFFPSTSFMCKDCEYFDPCRKWQGNGKA